MDTATANEMYLADRIWVATALLHQAGSTLNSFTKDQIRQKLREEGLDAGTKEGSINAHLKEHCVANVPPSSGKYRMLFETRPGMLRLFRPGDLTHPGRVQPRKPSKWVPRKEEIPAKYWNLLEWYEGWSQTGGRYGPSGSNLASGPRSPFDDDPLIQLSGSGSHIWADEHADEYVQNLRREDL